MEKYFDASKVKPPASKMNLSQETFIALRDLSISRGTMFRWYQLRDCFAAINPAKGKHTAETSWKMTLGNMLRGWLASGVILKIEKGLYKFSHLGMNTNLVGIRLYSSPGLHRPLFVQRAHEDWRMRELLVKSNTY